MSFIASRTTWVLAMAALLSVPAVAVAGLPRPPALHEILESPWWIFVVLFCVTEAFVLKLRVRGQLEGISLSEIPLVIGLVTGEPRNVLISRMIAGLLVFSVVQRHTPLKSVFNVMLIGSSTASAIAVFGAVLGRLEAVGPVKWISVPIAVMASGLFEGAVIVLVIGWYVGPRPAREVLRELAFSVLVPVTVSLIGLATVYALISGAAIYPLAMTGVAAMLGYRAFAALSDRHASLERLYVLSDALALAPRSDGVVASVLTESADLMRTDYGEIALTGFQVETPVRWRMRHGEPLVGPEETGPAPMLAFPPTQVLLVTGVTAAEKAFLADRGLDEALIVPLRVDDEVGGHLMVGDRRAEERPLAMTDGRLLETVANHAVVALRNGRLMERLQFEARHDELTGLPNRLDLRDRLDELATRAAHGGKPLSVMVLDFDGFKSINDTLGHQAGDELLRVLAARFRVKAGDEAMVARMGGDEFAILSTACSDPESAMDLARRVLASFDEPVAVSGAPRLRLGGSLGIALGPRHGLNGSDLLRNADIAMYAAKAGAGGARLFSQDLVEITASALTLASDLRDAVSQQDIGVAIQPLVRLDTGAIHSVEVLARWTHPDLGEIPPETFFAAAERCGQITRLSTRILTLALTWCNQWQTEGYPVRVAVNLAPRWLADSSLPDQVAMALERHSVPAGSLCLEITESSVIADPRRAIETLEELRAMGVHLSVDDFGTGYSSLTYLSRLPVDQMKIDKSFVSRLLDSNRDRAIVRSIIDLGRNLDLEVVAEGITDSATRRILQDLGCGLGQGFLFSRPVDGSALRALFDSRGLVAPTAPPLGGGIDQPVETPASPLAGRPPVPRPAPAPGPIHPQRPPRQPR
ncbi:MAG TPA: EAL domain-containing protein [Kineosporiaceae bacterium]|nr:EAL domain-containing protein [Kineosporiaceae bacterium]